MDISDRWLVALAPTVLVVVACHQLLLATTADLTPWKGGGFGMFTTVDRPSGRVVTLNLETVDGPVAADVMRLERIGEHRSAFVNAAALPDDRRLERLERAILTSRWVLDGDGHARRTGGSSPHGSVALVDGDGQPVEVAGFELVVWRRTYDHPNRTIVPEVITRRAWQAHP